MARVEDQANLGHLPFFTSCLSAEAIKEGLNALLEDGLIDPDDDDGDAVRDFEDFTELKLRADEIAREKREDDDRIRMDATRWDSFMRHCRPGVSTNG